jgi:hypothetical protein
LVALYGKKELSMDVRRVILLGLLTITHNMLNVMMNTQATCTHVEIEELCVSSILSIQSIESIPEILPTDFESDMSLVIDITYIKWLMALKAPQISDTDNEKNRVVDNNPSRHEMNDTNSNNNSSTLHILILVPTVMRSLKVCQSKKIRELLEQVIGSVDLGKFITDYFVQLDTVKALQEENNRLVEDIQAHKAVQSLGML